MTWENTLQEVAPKKKRWEDTLSSIALPEAEPFNIPALETIPDPSAPPEGFVPTMGAGTIPKTNLTGFGLSVKEEFTRPTKGAQYIPILGGVIGAAENLVYLAAADRLQKGFDYSQPTQPEEMMPGAMGIRPARYTTREADQKVLDDLWIRLEKQQRGYTFWGKVAKGLLQLPTWMAEFALTGGLANLGSTAAKKAGVKLMGRWAKTKAGQLTLKGAGWTGGAITRATLGLTPRIVEKGLERRVQVQILGTEQEGWATSFAKAWGDITIEAASETAGATITGVPIKFLRKSKFGNAFFNALQKGWMKATGSSAGAFARKMATTGGYSNLIGEMGEEWLGTILRAITDVEDFGADEIRKQAGLLGEAGITERLVAGLKEHSKNVGVEAVVLSAPMAGQVAIGQLLREKPPGPLATPRPATPIPPTTPWEDKLQEAAEVTTMDAELAQIQRQPPTVAKITPEVAPVAITPTKPTVAAEEGKVEIPTAKPTILSGYPEIEYKFTGEWRRMELGAASNIARRNRAIAEVPVYKSDEGKTVLDMTQRVTIKPYRGKQIKPIHTAEKVPPPTPKPEAAAKEAWEMTKAEYIRSGTTETGYKQYQRDLELRRKGQATTGFAKQWDAKHAVAVRDALSEGKPIPRAVLEEYKSEKWAQEALARIQPEKPTPKIEPKTAIEKEKLALEAKKAESKAKPKLVDLGAAPKVEEEIDETGGISTRRRNKITKQLEDQLIASDIYQAELAGIEEQPIGIGYYYVPEKFRTEVEDIIGKKRTKLRQMFTFKLSDKKIITLPDGKKAEIGPTEWTSAVQEQLGRGREGIEDTTGAMDISDFAQAVKDAHEAGERKGRVNAIVLDKLMDSPDLPTRYAATKLWMTIKKYSADEIDAFTQEFMDENQIAPEVFDNEWVGPEAKKLKEIKAIADKEEQDRQLEILAREKVLEEERQEAKDAVRDVLKKNKIEAEVREVEEIEEEDIPFEQRGRPTGATITTPASEQIVLLAYGADSTTGYHEGYHVLRRRLTSKDIKVLDKHFKGNEEAEATAFAEFARTGKAARSYLKGIWRKLVELLRKIKSELQGKGFRTVNDIFGEIQAGRIAKTGLRPGAVRYEKGLSYNEILKRQRELEGVMAAVRDPKTGKVYTAHTHKAAIEKAPRGGGVWGRLSDEWDKGTDNTGYVDKNGKFISRTEAEKRWNVLTIEDVEDVREGRIQYERGVFGQPIERQLRLPFKERQAAIKRAVVAEKAKPGKKIAGKPYEYWRPRGRVKIKAKLVKAVDAEIQRTMKPRNNDVQTTPEQIANKLGGLFGAADLFYNSSNPLPEVQEAFAQLVRGGPLFDIRYETTTEKLIRDVERQARIKATKARLKKRAGLARKAPAIKRIKIKIDTKATPGLVDEWLEGQVRPPIPPPPSKRPVQGQEFSPDWYRRNAKKHRTVVLFRGISDLVGDTVRGIDKAIDASEQRLERISPELFRRESKYGWSVRQRFSDMLTAVKPFIRATKRMSKQDWRELDLALKNRDRAMIYHLLAKYDARLGLIQKYEMIRDIEDDIYRAAIEVGIDMRYLHDYWHRQVKDKKGFLRYFQQSEHWSAIMEAVKRKAIQSGRKVEEITDDEKILVINSLLRGYRTGAVMLARPGAAKERTIDIIDDKINKFYADSREALIHYLRIMSGKISAREFFGGETREIRRIRGNQSARWTRLSKYRRGEGLTPGASYADAIKRTEEAIKVDAERLERLQAKPLKETIGGYVLDLVQADIIDPAKEREIIDILKGIFDPKSAGRAMRFLKTSIYLDTLNSLVHAITQLEEISFSFMKSPHRAIPALIRSVARRSRIRPKDIGIRSVGIEFEGQSMERALRTMLRANLFTWADHLGKETLINTALNKYKAQARSKKEKPALIKKLVRLFGKNYKEVIEDLKRVDIENLKRGDMPDRIKYLLFCEVAGVHPISEGTMPEYYNRAGNLRILYTLKTFYLRRFSFLRRECFRDMKHIKTFPQGFARLVWMLAWFALLGVGTDWLKDFILGRTFNLTDSIVDTLARVGLFSRYEIYRPMKPSERFARKLAPPMKWEDAVYQDFKTVTQNKDRGFELWRSVPVVGEFYYWWFGRGRERIEEEEGSGGFD